MENLTNKIIHINNYRQKHKKHLMLRLFAAALFFVSLTAVLGLKIYSYHQRIPSTLYFMAEQEQELNLGVPATGKVTITSGSSRAGDIGNSVTVDLSSPVKMLTGGQDHYGMEVRLFGLLPIKNIDIRVIEGKQLIPMGTPVGIYMRCKGVLVIGVSEFETISGEMTAPAKNLLKAGDYVQKVNGVELDGKDALIQEIKNSGGKSLQLTIERDGVEKDVLVRPRQNALGEYKLGIWVRDNVQGVGTMTYLEADGSFGALGHGIADVDTGLIMEVKDGFLYQTEIVDLRKGENGFPGEMTGRIVYDDQFILGAIDKNCAQGVFGSCILQAFDQAREEPLPIGFKQEIELGPAEILCTLDDTPRRYQVEITKLHLDQDNVNRGIELKVTDPELLRETGGIIQGMSGSPILQNGKIVGAVTHVLVNAPERGYGIFIENMLEEGTQVLP